MYNLPNATADTDVDEKFLDSELKKPYIPWACQEKCSSVLKISYKLDFQFTSGYGYRIPCGSVFFTYKGKLLVVQEPGHVDFGKVEWL